MAKRKITVPKAGQIRSILNKYKETDLSDFDFISFLKNQNFQNEILFSKDNLSIDEILYYVWCSRYIERDLIKNKELELEHPFFKRILEIMNLKQKSKTDMLEFFTLMYFEDNSICSHWNFKDKIEKQRFDNLVIKTIYYDGKTFPLFLENLTKDEFSNIKFVSEKNPELPPLDIKSKIIKDFLYSHGGAKKGYQKIIELIDTNLNVIPDYNALVEHLNKNDVLYYPLSQLNVHDLNKTFVTHKFHGVEQTTTIENLAKYNSMDKGLSECLDLIGYDLDGKTYRKEQFADLVNYFAQEPFLKNNMVNFFYGKARKAAKKEKKLTWQYYATLIAVGNSGSGETAKKKVNKI
jgi:hypothetical protein